MHNNKQFECKLCKAQINDKNSLQNYISVQHEGNKTACKFCNKMFKWRSSLKYHCKSCGTQ